MINSKFIESVKNDKILSVSDLLDDYELSELTENEKTIYFIVLKILSARYHLKNSNFRFDIVLIMREQLNFYYTKLNKELDALNMKEYEITYSPTNYNLNINGNYSIVNWR